MIDQGNHLTRIIKIELSSGLLSGICTSGLMPVGSILHTEGRVSFKKKCADYHFVSLLEPLQWFPSTL